MAPLVRRSILKEFLIFACVATPLAFAQHPIGRPTGGVVHPAAPPILRAPLSPAPMVHAPMLHMPMIPSSVSAPRSLGQLGLRPHSVRPAFDRFGAPFVHFRRCWSSTNQYLFSADPSGDCTPVGGRTVTFSGSGRLTTPPSPHRAPQTMFRRCMRLPSSPMVTSEPTCRSYS